MYVRARASMYACVCLYTGPYKPSARDVHACNRYFHACIPVKGQPFRMRASSRTSSMQISHISARNTKRAYV